MRQRHEDEERKIAAQAAERAKKITVFEHFWGIYQERVRKLMSAGSQFIVEINQVLAAYDSGNVEGLYEAAHILNNNTLEPLLALLDEMKPQIVLESMGAQEFRNAWPLGSVDGLLTILSSDLLSSLPHEAHNAVGYMLQSLRAICQPIMDAVPLENPLDEPEPHVFGAKPIPLPAFQHWESEKMKKEEKEVKRESPKEENEAKNFSSFAAMAASQAKSRRAAPY